MVANKFPNLDLEASLERLSDWIAVSKDVKPSLLDSKKYLDLAEELKEIVGRLDDGKWFYLEDKFDEDPPPEISIDGKKIPYPGNNAQRYQILLSNMRELADVAAQIGNESPKPRQKPWQALAADFFLHIWVAAEKDKPAMSDASEAVKSFSNVLEKGGCPLSVERVRGLLSQASQIFDPFYCVDRWTLDRLMVWHQ